nr:PQQ-binding-like beta-propeller repeat protein [Ferrimicrobium acidiphilum]
MPGSARADKTENVEGKVAVALTNPREGGADSLLYGLNAQTGKQMWIDSLPQTALSVVGGLQDHEVAVMGTGGGDGISIYQGSTGKLIKTWYVPGMNAGFGESASVGGNGTMLFVSYGSSPTTDSTGNVAAYDIETGTELWSHQSRLPAWIATSSDQSTVGVVSVISVGNSATSDNLFTLFDAKSGKQLFATNFQSQVIGLTHATDSNVFAIAESNDIRVIGQADRKVSLIPLRDAYDPIGIPGGITACSGSSICFRVMDGVAALTVSGNQVKSASDVIDTHSYETWSAMACSSDCDNVWFLGVQATKPVLERVAKHESRPEILSRPLKGIAASLALV